MFNFTGGHYQSQWRKQASTISLVHPVTTELCVLHVMFAWSVGNQQMNHGKVFSNVTGANSAGSANII
jgi:hypothetical protein